jgi:hypothetical protein
MGLLDKISWGRPKPRPVGQELESGGRGDGEIAAYKDALIKAGLFLGLVVITAMSFPRGEVYEYTVQVGDTWRQQTLVAPFNFPIYKDKEKVEQERDEARQQTPPYFQEVTNARERLDANRDTLARQLDRVMEAYAEFRYHQVRDQADRAEDDSTRYVRLRRTSMARLTPAQWEAMAEAYVRQLPGLSQRSRTAEAEGQRLDERLLASAYELGVQLNRVGVMNRPRDSISTDQIIVRNEAEREQRAQAKDNVYGLNEAFSYVRDQLRGRYADNTMHANIAYAFFRDIFQPDLRYMKAETLEERRRRARKVSAIRGGVEEGEIVVSKGERITEDVKRKLTSLERVKNERIATKIVWKQTSAEFLFALLSYFFLFFYIYLLRRDIWSENRQLLLIALILAFIVGIYAVAVRLPWAQLYAVPVALASVVLTIIFNSRIGLFATLVLAFIGGQMLGLDLEYTFATFLAGSFGIFSVRDIKNRGQFVLSAGLIFVGYALVLTASWLYLGTPAQQLGGELMFAAIGSSFTITSYLLLWVLERTFDVTTDLTLLELSDTNNKLLKQLSLRAPGSFNHSLQVANLAEAAADRIGAHTLLTRVGALYHDIGKMRQPEYFVENQRGAHNPHDRLKPRMSALIIARHVKDGLEMAKEENLPKRVQKFIPMHHGTARIEYFYRKAVGETDETDSPVLESEFRYPGPRPDSKETGILMLADSVEAASRSLDDPSHKRLKSLIDLIFKERIEDGQLDDTDLTFRDLRQIKETFLQMLLGVYHVRVKYPDQDEEEEEDATPLVSAAGMDVDAGVSILLERDVWGTPEQSVSAERLQRVPGVHDRRAPRPKVAEASQFKRLEQSAGDGTLESPPAGAVEDGNAVSLGEHPSVPRQAGPPAGGAGPEENGSEADGPEENGSEAGGPEENGSEAGGPAGEAPKENDPAPEGETADEEREASDDEREASDDEARADDAGGAQGPAGGRRGAT